jgi:hypothetical protein
MTKHTYVRAYMAGIFTPALFLIVIMAAYCAIRYIYNLPVPIERVIVFPMAVVPNLWGLWNTLYVAFFARRHISLGLYGGALPLLLAPCGYAVARLLHFPIPNVIYGVFPIAFPIGMALYYLAWKYIVGFLNAELGIA